MKRGTWRWLCGAVAACALGSAWARGFDYGLLTQPDLQRCDELRWRADGTAAQGCYRALLGRNDAGLRAEAAWALGDVKSANEFFRAATRAQPRSVPLRLRWGALYLDTHQDAEAYKLFQEAQQLEPKNAWAQIDIADVLMRDYAKEADAALQSVLQNTDAPPGVQLRAHLLAARGMLESGELEDGGKQLELAAGVARSGQLPTLELQTLQAALAQLQGRDTTAMIGAIAQTWPGYGELYLTLGHFYDIRRRYDEATALYRKAMETDATLWEARVQVGTGLLREGLQSEARTQFEAAYKGDPFNPVSANTLRLLDQLARFDTLVFPEPAAGAAATAPQLIVRVNKSESAVLAPYVRTLAARAMAQYAQRYRYTPRQPITVEIYDSHEDFAVRTAGMPGLGLLGVTFGHVLAMDSPSSRPVNEFHWGSTLWHELAHVYTLEATQHRVPRWFSEGISVYEEWSSGPTQGISVPGYAWAAIAEGKLLPVANLDRGFIRPAYAQQVQVSYMQAGLICEFIVKQFGADKLQALLAQYGRGADTPTAVQAALGLADTAFDRQFDEYLHREFGAVLGGVKSWSESRAAATRAAKARNWSEAIAAAQRALQVLPADVEDGSPYLPLAEAQFASGQQAAGIETLANFWHRGGHDPQALGRLATAYYGQGRKDEAIAVLQDVNYVAPFDETVHGRLGDWLLERDRAADALSEYQVALALKPPDAAMAHYRLARAHQALAQPLDAHTETLRALEIAPSFRPAQRLLLQLADAGGGNAGSNANGSGGSR